MTTDDPYEYLRTWFLPVTACFLQHNTTSSTITSNTTTITANNFPVLITYYYYLPSQQHQKGRLIWEIASRRAKSDASNSRSIRLRRTLH